MYYIIAGIVLILVVSALIGLKRGLFRTLFSFIGLVLSLGVAYIAAPYVSNYVIENTEFYVAIEDKVYDKLESKMKKKVRESLENSGVTDEKELDKLTEAATAEYMAEDPDKATQMQLIDSFNIPEYLKTSYIENNNDGVYEALGITSFFKYISSYTAKLIVSTGTYIVLFVLLRLVIILIGIIVGHIIDFNPVISGANRLCGMILGLGVGLVIIWIFMLFAGIIFGKSYDAMISGNAFLEALDQNNIIMRILMNY